MVGKQGRLWGSWKKHVVNALRNTLQSGSRQVWTAPVAACLEKIDILCIRDDDIWKIQSLWLMDRHDPHTLSCWRRTDWRILLFPEFQESSQVVSICSHIVLQAIHERLYVENFTCKSTVSIRSFQATQKRLRHIHQRQAVIRHSHIQRLCQIAVYFIIRIVDIGHEGNQTAYSKRTLYL